jgi:hypothetical protein
MLAAILIIYRPLSLHLTSRVQLTQTSPLAQLFTIGDLDERNLVLGAKRNDKFLVRLLLASLIEDTHMGLATIERLGCLSETAGESVVDEGKLQDALEGFENGHLAFAGGGIAADFDFGGLSHGGCGLFSVGL